jgi:hypothetical protein
MIIVELNGGLGNQLFQYTAGLSLSQYHNVPLKVNPSSFNKPDVITGTQRHFELDNLEEPPSIATRKEVSHFLDKPGFQSNLEKLLPFHRRSIYKEKNITFDSQFYRSRKEVYLKGNRQSERYFIRHADLVRKKLRLKQSVIQRVEGFAAQLRDTESVAVHIRRGDYLTNIAMDVLGLIPPAHYEQAFEYLTKRLRSPKAFVFSDDIEWAKANLRLNGETEYVSGDISISAIEDFYLISQCKHQVIANSTFSWWAAWLNPNPDKIVIAPEKWFNNAPYDTRDLIPEGWIRM